MDEPTLVEIQPGVKVELDVLDIARRVEEYDENLYIQYVPPGLADIGDAPYRLVERGKDGKDHVVFYIWELDARVLERIYAADTQKHNILESMNKKNTAAKEEEQRRYQDKMDEAKDMLLHAMRTSKTEYTIRDGDRKFKV